LLLSTQPITSRRLCQVAGLADPTQARTLIRRLNEHYERGGSAFRVEEVAGGWQLLTHPSFGGWLRRLRPQEHGIRLSAPALETLAVVAYRQPVLRAHVESIRGVQCGEMLRQLMDRDLVRIVGKSHDLGRPFLYGTTPRFLQAFGLRALEDLPRREQLQPPPPRNMEPATSEVIPGTGQDQDLPESTHDLKEEQHT
jgi:segregation and condensation protein B